MTKAAPAKKAGLVKKIATKVAPVKKAAVAKTAPMKKTGSRKVQTKTSLVKSPPTKSAARATKAAPAKKTVAKNAPAKKAATVTKAIPVKKAVAKAPAKAPAKKAAATKAPAKAPAKKAAATKAPAKAPAEKATVAKSAPVKKAAPVAKAVDAVVEPEVKKSVMPPRPPRPPAPEPKPMKPVKYPFDAKFLQSQRELLLFERGRLLHDADTLTAEANALAELREPGDVQFDEESGEGDTLAVERERDLALSAQFRDQIVEIDRAMLKIDAGTYGICEVSGQPIPRERLKAIAWARERVEYKVGGFSRR